MSTKPGKFRLATLLRLRESARDHCRAELAEALRVDELLEYRQSQINVEAERLKEFFRLSVSPGSVNVDRLIESQRYELALKAQYRQLANQRATVAAEIERRRQRLVEANREVRVLEKLRERQAERQRIEDERRLRKQLDEIAQQRVLHEEVC